MKITKKQLALIIKEELTNVIKEMSDDEWMYGDRWQGTGHGDQGGAAPPSTSKPSCGSPGWVGDDRAKHPDQYAELDAYQGHMREEDGSKDPNWEADYDAGYDRVEAAHRSGKALTPRDIPEEATEGWRQGFMDAYEALGREDLGF